MEAHGDVYRVLVQGGLGVDSEVGAIVDRLRRTTVDRVATRAGLPRSVAVEVALYGWVCFTENACLEWLRRREDSGPPDLDRAALVRLLSGALTGAIAGCGEVADA